MHFFSHGSTMMLGEESESADYWKKCGDEALAQNIKGVVIMVSIVNGQPNNVPLTISRVLTGTALVTESS